MKKIGSLVTVLVLAATAAAQTPTVQTKVVAPAPKVVAKISLPASVKSVPKPVKITAPSTTAIEPPKVSATTATTIAKYTKENRIAIVQKALEGDTAQVNETAPETLLHVGPEALGSADFRVFMEHVQLIQVNGSVKSAGFRPNSTPTVLSSVPYLWLGISAKAKTVALLDCQWFGHDKFAVETRVGTSTPTKQELTLQDGHLLIPVMNTSDAAAQTSVTIVPKSTTNATGWTGCDISYMPLR